MQSSSILRQWLEEVDMDLDLVEFVVEYVQGRGRVTMEEVVWEAYPQLCILGASQDKVGWRQFLEGMISTEIIVLSWQCAVKCLS